MNEEYLAAPGAGQIWRRSWSPNRIELDVALSRPTRLLVNQNHAPGWRASVGRVVSHEGLLAVELPAGKSHLVLRYLPTSAVGGAVISGASLLALIWFLRSRRPTRS